MQRNNSLNSLMKTSQNPFGGTDGVDSFDETLAFENQLLGDGSDGGGDGNDDDDALELPVDPDEGMPVIPDDERVIDVPS